MSDIVVDINLMPELEMVEKGLGVNETQIFANPASTSHALLRQYSIIRSQRSIRHHQLHNIVFHFHTEDLEVDAVQSAWEAIGCADLFQIEIGVDRRAVNELRPVTTLFNQCRCVDDADRRQLYQSF